MCETERQAIMEFIEFDRFVEQDDCDKYNMLQQSACEIRSLEKENKQLEEVIEKVREYIKENRLFMFEYDDEYIFLGISDEEPKKELLKILDKVKEN